MNNSLKYLNFKILNPKLCSDKNAGFVIYIQLAMTIKFNNPVQQAKIKYKKLTQTMPLKTNIKVFISPVPKPILDVLIMKYLSSIVKIGLDLKTSRNDSEGNRNQPKF